jgi:hypothetical protein
LKKYLQIIEGLLCIFSFTIFLSAFMIDSTQLFTGIGGWNVVQDRIDLKNLFAEIRRKGSTSQVSRELDVSMGNISDWKNGRSVPNAVSLVKLADYFGCSVDYLLGRTEKRDMS